MRAKTKSERTRAMDGYGAAVPTGCALCVWSQHHTAVVSFKASGFTGFMLRHCRLSASTTGRKIVRKLYLFLAFVGFVLPYYFFVSFLVTNGPDLPLLFDQLFANDISTFFAADLSSQRWPFGYFCTVSRRGTR